MITPSRSIVLRSSKQTLLLPIVLKSTIHKCAATTAVHRIIQPRLGEFLLYSEGVHENSPHLRPTAAFQQKKKSNRSVAQGGASIANLDGNLRRLSGHTKHCCDSCLNSPAASTVILRTPPLAPTRAEMKGEWFVQHDTEQNGIRIYIYVIDGSV